MNPKSIISGMVIIIIGLSLTGTVWDQVYGDDGVLACRGYNSSHAVNDCQGNTCGSTCCINCVNGTSETFLKLVPMLWVILVLVVGALVGKFG